MRDTSIMRADDLRAAGLAEPRGFRTPPFRAPEDRGQVFVEALIDALFLDAALRTRRGPGEV